MNPRRRTFCETGKALIKPDWFWESVQFSINVQHFKNTIIKKGSKVLTADGSMVLKLFIVSDEFIRH